MALTDSGIYTRLVTLPAGLLCIDVGPWQGKCNYRHGGKCSRGLLREWLTVSILKHIQNTYSLERSSACTSVFKYLSLPMNSSEFNVL